ncbi:MAG: PTS sugar transporter subunit IIA [Deltaproteobacteria bacterium]|nr:PTS sugar transporter subunit IIA [Deltaproteobacteria bacterium]
MRLADVLKEDYIITDLKARGKRQLLEEMVSCAASRVDGVDAERVLNAILEREKFGSTGIGHGVAIPHGKIKGITEIRVFFGRSRPGVDFDSMDKRPVYLFFMIVAPENSTAAHLKIMAGISHLLKNQEFRHRLTTAETAGDVYRVIVEADRRMGLSL